MKDKWRYVFLPDWALEEMMCNEGEEEAMIDRLDGTVEEEEEFDAYSILSSLSDKEAKIVQCILYDGKTFAATGIEMSLSKQRVHQIFKGALAKLKGVLNGASK